jgi:predicted esterase
MRNIKSWQLCVPVVSIKWMRIIFTLFILLVSVQVLGDELYTETGTQASILPAEQAQALASTLPVDQPVSWRVYVPQKFQEKSNGVLVYVSPTSSGAPNPEWLQVFEDKKLIWVAAEGFGNSEPGAQRVLAAVMGLARIQQQFQTDSGRIYIAGLSGGGRIASQAATRFPRMFNGALYIAGVDFWTEAEKPLLDFIAQNRYVFLTGSQDFNRREIRKAYKKYQEAGVKDVLLMDLEGYGHHNPDAAQLARALEFLDRQPEIQ